MSDERLRISGPLYVAYMDCEGSVFGICFVMQLYVSSLVFQSSSRETDIRESPPSFENRIMARVYIGALRVGLCTKKLHFVSLNWRMENKSCSMWVQLYKIDYSDYLKCLISRIN